MPFWQLLLLIFGYAALVFVMLPVHELAHAWAATRLGDDTPRWHGRLSFNPLKHLDPIGTVMLVLFGFGYARPVPINPRNFSNPKRDTALTALAGPASNVLMALLSLLLFRMAQLATGNKILLAYAGVMLVSVFARINLQLAVFNLLPIPPLDGSRIFSAVLPARVTWFLDRYHEHLRIVVLVLIVSGALDAPIDWLATLLGNLLCTIVGLPNQF